jgi:Peptidase S46
MKCKAFLFSLLFIIPGLARSDEGMWLPFLVGEQKYAEMKEMGLKLTSEELYDINNSSLKDAIVMLDNGSCSAEIVSSKGLLFTNHHCGYDDIQVHSSVEHDYLSDGFWAMSMEEELPNPGKIASLLIRVEDVTSQITKELNGKMSEQERNAKIEEVSEAIISKAIEGTNYNGEVSIMYEGSEFYLFVYETFRDIRLVGAPPSSIGDYGGDTDNWMWPRHTADFSIFRIYTAPDGSPADYSAENIPLKPKHFLPVSIDGIKKDDFSMVWGNPGTTDRYLSSFGVHLALSQVNPSISKLGGIMLDNMKKEMEKSDKVRIQYASKYASIANFWKLYTGQSKWLDRLDVYHVKKNQESEFAQWFEQNEERKAKYGRVLYNLKNVHIDLRDGYYQKVSIYFNLIHNFGIECLSFSNNSNLLIEAINSGNQKNIDEAVSILKEDAEDFYKDFYLPVEKQNMIDLLSAYKEDIPDFMHADFMTLINDKYKGEIEKYAEDVYNKSIFASKESYLSFLNKPSIAKLEKDPIIILANSLNAKNHHFMLESLDVYDLLDKSNRAFIAGLREMNEEALYPNANSTMRVTYGKAIDYYPADAVHYHWQTFLKGVIEKEDPDNDEFIVPARLKEIYETKDFGRYGEGDKMPTCFITNHDITGGSSGSSVINGKGELIGIAFDSNWEGVSGDIAFNPDQQRCVNVDIRYVLLIIDKFAGCTRLIDEMNIVKTVKIKDPVIEKAVEEPVESM